MPSWWSCVRTWRRTSALLVTVRRPVSASLYETVPMPSRTASCTARDTSPLCDSAMAMSSAERVCASSRAVSPRWLRVSAPDSISPHRWHSISSSICV